jgi:hypothetical protein
MIENRGALPEITDHGVEKREQKEFLSKRLCFLTCLLMGDPNPLHTGLKALLGVLVLSGIVRRQQSSVGVEYAV